MDDEVSGLIASPGTYAQSPLFLHGPSPYFVLGRPRQPDRRATSHRGEANSRTCSALIISTEFGFVRFRKIRSDLSSDREITNRGKIVSPSSFHYRIERDADKKFTLRIMGNAKFISDILIIRNYIH